MKIIIWTIGKAHESYVKEGIEEFTKRISRYFPVDWRIIPSPKNAASLSENDLKRAECDRLLSILHPKDMLVVLDEKGLEFTSEKLAKFIQAKADAGTSNLVFLIGGAYGVDERIIKRADRSWSLSSLVFPHQLVRLILSEQLYRACTIMRNEKYHHS